MNFQEQSEAQNRHSSFSAFSLMPTPVDLLRYQYGLGYSNFATIGGSSKIWESSFSKGIKWTGIPGFRALAQGQDSAMGGGRFFKAGVSMINKPLHNILSRMDWYNNGNYNVLSKGLSTFGSSEGLVGMASRALGGHQSSLMMGNAAFRGNPELAASAEKALGTNWFKSLYSKETAMSRVIEKKGSKIAGISKGKVIDLGTRGTAWKFAMSKKILPFAIKAGNFAFWASMIAPVFSALGTVAASRYDLAERALQSLGSRKLDFGGTVHQSFMNQQSLTERQRALSELKNSRSNARTFIGNESSLYHS